MTLAELRQLLLQTGFPVFYHHWKKSTQYPECPLPPFIAYLAEGEPNFIADSKAYVKIKNIQVELYTDKKDLAAEEKLEGLFDGAGIAWTADNVWIEEEQLYEKIYALGLI